MALAADAFEPRRLVPVGVFDVEPATGMWEDDSVEYLRFTLPLLLPPMMLLTGMADDEGGEDGETGSNGTISFVGVVPF